jgi:hypothetical protein
MPFFKLDRTIGLLFWENRLHSTQLYLPTKIKQTRLDLGSCCAAAAGSALQWS